MGTGSSNVSYGVPGNPRVDFASKRSKKENKIVRIDVPPLVKLSDGTLRYRYNKEYRPGEKAIEKPYEGKQLAEKSHYFYHPKYTGKNADKDPEWKYCYVYKGPERARQKQIYYVFGKGLNVGENGFLETNYKAEEQSFERPIFYKTHGHFYMELIFLKREIKHTDYSQESGDLHKDHSSDDERSDSISTEYVKDIELCLPTDEQISEIKVKLARRFVTISAHIHLYLHSLELKDNKKLKDLARIDKGQKAVWILLHPK